MSVPKIVYSVQTEPEELGISGQFDNRAIEAKIQTQLNAGNTWAWCTVKVIAQFEGIPAFTGISYLGACSYENEEAFKQGGYWEQLQKDALLDLKEDLDRRIKQGESAKALLAHTGI